MPFWHHAPSSDASDAEHEAFWSSKALLQAPSAEVEQYLSRGLTQNAHDAELEFYLHLLVPEYTQELAQKNVDVTKLKPAPSISTPSMSSGKRKASNMDTLEEELTPAQLRMVRLQVAQAKMEGWTRGLQSRKKQKSAEDLDENEDLPIRLREDTDVEALPHYLSIALTNNDHFDCTPTAFKSNGQSVAYFIHRPAQSGVIALSMAESIYILSEKTQKQVNQAFTDHDHVFIIFYTVAPKGENNGSFKGLARVERPPMPQSDVNPYPTWHPLHRTRYEPFPVNWAATKPVGFWEDPKLLRAIENSFSPSCAFKKWPWLHKIDTNLGYSIAEALYTKAAASDVTNQSSDLLQNLQHPDSIDNGEGSVQADQPMAARKTSSMVQIQPTPQNSTSKPEVMLQKHSEKNTAILSHVCLVKIPPGVTMEDMMSENYLVVTKSAENLLCQLYRSKQRVFLIFHEENREYRMFHGYAEVKRVQLGSQFPIPLPAWHDKTEAKESKAFVVQWMSKRSVFFTEVGEILLKEQRLFDEDWILFPPFYQILDPMVRKNLSEAMHPSTGEAIKNDKSSAVTVTRSAAQPIQNSISTSAHERIHNILREKHNQTFNASKRWDSKNIDYLIDNH
ncbi:hypothetical protein BT63DRAFT_450396 [Microthyrium microscopicum]|uniref:YTH domain-containing protein n=1 Tax=Microthyrium microscopicum TaxID=703497 RepID=A0A6A6UVA3_9PEZI|nr:hypothetical protein BT63DRAFT_450396 [Microthyrium microscopicum]